MVREEYDPDNGPVGMDYIEGLCLVKAQVDYLLRHTTHVALDGGPAWETAKRVHELLDLFTTEQRGTCS
jgi:hypothetical protein